MPRLPLVAVVIFIGVAHAADEDIVTTLDGKALPPMKIVHDDFLMVKSDRGIAVHGWNIKKVDYGEVDANLRIAEERAEEKRWTLAMFYSQRAIEQIPQHAGVVEQSRYGLAIALIEHGSYAGFRGRNDKVYLAPAHYFSELLRDNPRSRYALSILAKLPYCLAAAGDLAAADAVLERSKTRIAEICKEMLDNNLKFKPLADRAQAELALTAARVWCAKAEAGKAEWREAVKASDDGWIKVKAHPEFAREWQKCRLAMFTLKKNAAELKAEAQEAIKKLKSPTDDSVLSAAYLALGRAHLMEAAEHEGAKRDLQARMSYADARWAFVHAQTYAIEDDNTAAAAYYYSGVSCASLKGTEPNAEETALRHFKTVLRNYPKSKVAEHARAELKNAGADL